jgi:hypothetical protein
LEIVRRSSENLSKLLANGVRIEPRFSKIGSKNANNHIMMFGYVFLVFAFKLHIQFCFEFELVGYKVGKYVKFSPKRVS